MKDIDSDGSGSIDFSEFIAATVNKTELLTEANLKVAF
jgi:Ca2+-binding EF-hand superfamily protein